MGPEALNVYHKDWKVRVDALDASRSETRVFTRLTPFASWRSEFILRTWLLRSLAKGKPAESEWQGEHGSPRPSSSRNPNAQVTYSTNLNSSINHLHGTFSTGVDQRSPRFIHGADRTGVACLSDPSVPSNKRIDRWGFADPEDFFNFADQFPGDSLYGLGAGDIVGVHNPMDVSHPHGMIFAEGFPGGRVHFRSVEESRGRSLAYSPNISIPELGAPQLPQSETICSVWIAKTPAVPDRSKGLIGMLTGSSHGIVSSYSLGTNSLGERRLDRGEVTARWVLSPGVPIIAFAIDENFSEKRHAIHRIWAVVLNALGEVYYMTSFPERPIIHRATRLDKQNLERLSWETGRTVCWTKVGLTSRVAKPDPYRELNFDGSYSPMGSCNGMDLSEAQIIAETMEIETFMNKKPRDFRQVCEDWDMRRRLEVDFASSDEQGAGESIIVICCGLDEGQSVAIKRFTRCKLAISLGDGSHNEPKAVLASASSISFSVDCPSWSSAKRRRSSATELENYEPTIVEEWRTSTMEFGVLKAVQITTTALDLSNFATLTASEDPLLAMKGWSTKRSPSASPQGYTSPPTSPLEIPGQRGRFMAAGTKTGIIIIWNIRHPIPSNGNLGCSINPICVIRTDSPQISSLALSALYLVHGGSDGLVQAWDPLASSSEPIRTLNSRFSSRARRRHIQPETFLRGVFSAGAVYLDPDPTVLRGIVSLGTQLRYWSYSSSKVEKYKSHKRRLRHSQRGSNQHGGGFSGTSRGALKEYIADERLELEREKNNRRKEEWLAGRFGTTLLGPGASEDEILAYATLLSKEAAATDEQRRKSYSSSSTDLSNSDIIVKDFGYPPPVPSQEVDHNLDADIAEAIRLSLQDHGDAFTTLGMGSSSFSVRYAKPKRKSPSLSPRKRALDAPGKAVPEDDLELALGLSLNEIEGEGEGEAKGEGNGKGKGRA